MKRDFDAVLTALDGSNLTREAIENEQRVAVPMTLKDVCVHALMAPLPGEETMSGIAKMSNYHLACKVHKGGKVDLSAEEISLLKDRVGRAWSTVIVGPAWTLLDPKE